MKTLIYTRGKDASAQILKCEEYAAANGLDVIGTADNENDLTSFVFSGNINCVLVAEAHRITRRRNEYIQAENMLKEFDVKLIAAGGMI